MSKKNGSPQFNFRKMGYRDESQMSRLTIKIAHMEKQIAACDANDDIDTLIDTVADLERQGLHLMIKIVEYLPEDYLLEGVDESEVDYNNPDSLLDVMRFGSMTLLGQDIAEARRNYKKKS